LDEGFAGDPQNLRGSLGRSPQRATRQTRKTRPRRSSQTRWCTWARAWAPPDSRRCGCRQLSGRDGLRSFNEPQPCKPQLNATTARSRTTPRRLRAPAPGSTVLPRIRLWIAPRRTHNGGTIAWTGTLAGGPFPSDGVTLYTPGPFVSECAVPANACREADAQCLVVISQYWRAESPTCTACHSPVVPDRQQRQRTARIRRNAHQQDAEAASRESSSCTTPAPAAPRICKGASRTRASAGSASFRVGSFASAQLEKGAAQRAAVCRPSCTPHRGRSACLSRGAAQDPWRVVPIVAAPSGSASERALSGRARAIDGWRP
jgi:hypothetical protein